MILKGCIMIFDWNNDCYRINCMGEELKGTQT